MAKYIKQEMSDLRGIGEQRSFYRMKTYRNLGGEEFIEKMASLHAGISKATVKLVLSQVAEDLAYYMGMGYTVTLDGIGTFKPTLGLRKGKEMDSMEGDETKRNAQSIRVDGINFRADKQLVNQTDWNCDLESGGVRRLCRSPYSKQERLELARKYLQEHPLMRVSDYVKLTGLSRTTATVELQEFRRNPESGIGTFGLGSNKVYVAK